LIGITPAKSHTINQIIIPEEFFRDFLRGHLDGDGSITVYMDKYNTYKNQNIFIKDYSYGSFQQVKNILFGCNKI